MKKSINPETTKTVVGYAGRFAFGASPSPKKRGERSSWMGWVERVREGGGPIALIKMNNHKAALSWAKTRARDLADAERQRRIERLADI